MPNILNPSLFPQLLESLYRQRWSPLDGLGALVLTPTRELAMQIFEELKKVGRQHEFSAALLIGGKNVKDEQERIGGMNILVCTPGAPLPAVLCSNIKSL